MARKLDKHESALVHWRLTSWDVIRAFEELAEVFCKAADVGRAVAIWDRRMPEELTGVLEAEEIE